MRKGWLVMAVLLTGGCEREAAEVPRAVEVREDRALEVLACSFNLRRAEPPDDGFRAWPRRVGRVLRAVHDLDPDVLGVQEAQHSQAADLWASLPGYGFYGVGRDDGRRAGEYPAILWKTSRFKADLDDAGTFWLSDTPEVPGSRSWGNEVVRAAAWIRLVDRSCGRGFYVFNTHFDHRNQLSRERGAELIARRIDARRRGDEPVVLLGDFNATRDNPALAYLTGRPAELGGTRHPAWEGGLVDVFARLHPGREVGSMHFWRDRDRPGWRVDHVLVSAAAEPLAAGVHREGELRELPSDHYPVWARVRWK